MSLDNPIRHPDTRSPEVMTRRGWWLVVLNLLLPGSAQVLAGNRRLGRFGLVCTLTLIGLLVVGLLVFLLWPTVIYTIFTNTILLTLVQIVLVFYAVLWVVLTLDMLRLVKLVRVKPSARGWVPAVTIVALVAFVGGAGYAAVIAGSTRSLVADVFADGASVEPIDGVYSFLLMGGDAGEDREGLRPDSLTVVTVDAETGRATMIGLTREMLWVPFPEDSPMHALYPDGYGGDAGCGVDLCKLNSIYTEVDVYHPDLYPDAEAHGSTSAIEAMKDAAEGITGIPIQFYVMVDMNAFAQMIDALGGVDIQVDERVALVGVEYVGDFTDVAWIEPGFQHMDGATALWYARSRYNSDDYVRMARQRQLQEAVIAQFTPTTLLTRYQDIAAAGSLLVRTDVPESMLGYFADLALKTREQPIEDLELVPPLVDPEFPDVPAIRQMVSALVYPPADTEG